MSSTTELSKLNHYKKLSQWQQLVCDCRNSGMTVRAWCTEHSISEKSYYYRQRKVWEAAQRERESHHEAGLASPGPAHQVSLPAIIPCAPPLVSERQAPAATPSLVLRSQTWTLEVTPGCDPELLRLALRAVKQRV